MSKSRGNVIDPLELIDAFGADALRFTIARGNNPGTDVSLSRRMGRRLAQLRHQIVERRPVRPSEAA